MTIRFLILASVFTALSTVPRPAAGADALPRSARQVGGSESGSQLVQPAGVELHLTEIAGDGHADVGKHSRWPLVLAGIYCVAVVLASLAGGWLPLIVRLTHTRLQLSMSLCGGLMLGIGLLHMLPHSVAVLGSLDRAVGWMLVGLLTMFFLIRAFHFHQHEPAEALTTSQPGLPNAAQHVHDHDRPAGAPSARAHHDHHHPAERLSWVGLLLGMGIHTLIDGMALAASVQVDAGEGGESMGLFGFGTFLAIVLHKPLDSVPISIMMRVSRMSNRLTHIVNGAFATLCPVGVLAFFLGFERFGAHQAAIVGCVLAFSAGVFLCISLSDLLPELEFHAHDRLKLSLALLVGVALAYAIGYIEPEHMHGEHGHMDDGHPAHVHESH